MSKSSFGRTPTNRNSGGRNVAKMLSAGNFSNQGMSRTENKMKSILTSAQ